ncbi:MAG: DUF1987 domain-containing protein [Chlorobi bacterium]|nr:DUF1987 domain-containing protein [Chlorobiota bacterium]
MEILSYQPEGYLPGIILDKESGKFEISGKTCPEDAIEFYEPVFEWLDEYAKNPLDETIFDFKLTYFNTVSSKILMMIMLRLEEIAEDGHNVKIRWFYPEDDEDLEEAGEDYESMLEIDFEMVPYQDEDDEDDYTQGLIDSLI